MMKKLTLFFILTIACLQLGVFADSYSIQPYPTPPGIVCEVTGMDHTDDGTLYICTRRGDIWAQKSGDWKRFAHGLHEPMGLLARTDGIIVTQRPEITKVIDQDGDGVADLYETITDQFSMEANFHQYNYGLVDRDMGALYGILSCSGLSKADGSPASAFGFSPIPYRMWSYQITSKGDFRPWSSGLRTANGIGKNLEGELFAADNQGDWVGTSMLHHLEEGDFHGHPAALRWQKNFPYHEDPESAPIELLQKLRKPPAIHFPHGELANSPGSPICDTTGGMFGPFPGQFFIGDIVHPRIIRVALEKVNGQYQGACFSFYYGAGLKAGICRLDFSPAGELILGRAGEGNWARGRPGSGLQKIAYSGTPPFEIQRIELQSEGFLFHFTQPIDQSIKLDPKNFGVLSYNYPYGPNYGYPKTDIQKVVPSGIERFLDAKAIKLLVPNLQKRKVYQFNLPQIQDTDGRALRNPVAYYTLNELKQN